jgi:hypothetical protein
MEAWLLETAVLELVGAALISWLVLVQWRGLWSGPVVPVAVATVDAVLVVGAGYWFTTWDAVRRRGPSRLSPAVRLRALQALYAVIVVVLLAFPVVALARGGDVPSLVLGGAVWAFAVAEFVHYFVTKINMRRRERGRPRPARLRRALQRAQVAARVRR